MNRWGRLGSYLKMSRLFIGRRSIVVTWTVLSMPSIPMITFKVSANSSNSVPLCYPEVYWAYTQGLFL